MLTHSDLVKIAEKWLIKSRGCGAVITEMVSSATETPDAIGFRDGSSTLIECKISKSDFLADLKKPFRVHSFMGMGNYRLYLCPEGIIEPVNLPEKWGLLWVNEQGKVNRIVCPKGNIWYCQKEFVFTEKNLQAEQYLLVSALRRLQGR